MIKMRFNTPSEALNFCGGQRPKHLTVSLDCRGYTLKEVTYGAFATRTVTPAQRTRLR